jgi:cell wall-associated NlpC family hydrolase
VTTRHSGRRRAAVRPTTPPTALCDAVTANADPVTRRSAVVAASSALLLAFGLPAATAAQAGDPAPEAAVVQAGPAVDVSGTRPDPEVSVPADARVDLTLSAVTDVTPPPAPESAPAPEWRAEPVSRSAERTAPAPDTPSAPAAPAEAAPAAETVAGDSVLSVAAGYVGTPYVYGGTTPAGFDCSGFVQYVYEQLGVSLPRTAAQQQKAGTIVPRSQAQPGDIVSFVGAGGVYHNGLYAGGNEMYDAPRTGKSVSKREMWSADVTFTRVG